MYTLWHNKKKERKETSNMISMHSYSYIRPEPKSCTLFINKHKGGATTILRRGEQCNKPQTQTPNTAP